MVSFCFTTVQIIGYESPCFVFVTSVMEYKMVLGYTMTETFSFISLYQFPLTPNNVET